MPDVFDNKVRRNREVRDIYAKLRKKYNAKAVMDFIEINYFIDEQQIYRVIRLSDDKPVENPSVAYQNAMRVDFLL